MLNDAYLSSLGSEGINLLMQMRTKKSIENLDKSIKILNDASNKWSFVITILASLTLIVASFQIYLMLFRK